MNPAALTQAVAADIAALDAAATLAEEALAYHREALILLAEGWQSETGSAIADFMNLQCVHAGDVVDALRRIAAELPESDIDATSDAVPGRPISRADAIAPFTDAAPSADPTGQIVPAPPADQMGPIAPAPAPAPGPVSPWIAPTSPPWNAPTVADTPWGAPGGLPAPAAPAAPALGDLGGALVGLVAEIAQALGSYTDSAPAIPGSDLGSLAADPPSDVTTSDQQTAPTVAHDHTDGPTMTDATPATGPEPAPVGLPTADPTGTSELPAPPPELLAAERPPEPETAVAPAPVADAPVPPPAPAIPPVDSPAAAAPADSPPAATAAEAEQAPCEIAADELPKVGE